MARAAGAVGRFGLAAGMRNTPSGLRLRLRRWLARAGLVLAIGACGSSPAHTSPTCEVAGEAGAEDVARARAACEQARARYAELFGVAAPRVLVQLSDKPSYLIFVRDGRWALRWPNTETLMAVGRQLGYRPSPGSSDLSLDEWVSSQWEQVLPHEIGHTLLNSALKLENRPNPAGQYGTPLPDWFDEGVAVWMEPDRYRTQRLSQVMRNGEAAPELDVFLSKRHPYAVAQLNGWRRTVTERRTTGRCTGVCSRRDERTRRITLAVDTLGRLSADTAYVEASADAATAGRELDSFYSPALAVLTYIHARGGAPTARRLLDRLRSSSPGAHTITGLPGLPGDASALQADWARWWRSVSADIATRK